MPTQVLPLTPGTNKKITEAMIASFANWEKEQVRLNFSKGELKIFGYVGVERRLVSGYVKEHENFG